MATLGRREVVRKNHQNRQPSIAAPTVNLIASSIKVQPVTTVGFQPTVPSSPIMREDFITVTGSKFGS
jgi:hypothetical protein